MLAIHVEFMPGSRITPGLPLKQISSPLPTDLITWQFGG